MAVEYGIARRILGSRDFVPLSQEEYERAKAAKQNLIIALGIEEKFNILLQNYAEFEAYLLTQCLHDTLFSDRNWESAIDQLFEVNRRLANVLTTCRLYLDQVKHDLNRIYGADCKQTGEVKKQANSEYDSRLGYRVMEALRNYMQHRSLPVELVNHKAERRDEPRAVVHTMDANLNVSSLADDPEFNQRVLAELQAVAEKPSVKPLLREYIAGLGVVHARVRELLAKDAAGWEEQLRQVQTDYRTHAGAEDLTGLALVARDDRGIHVEHSDIFMDFIDRRQRLLSKNRHTQYYAAQVITNE